MFPYFEIFGKTIGTYALCAFAGFIASGITASIISKKYKIQYEDIILLMLSAIFGLFIGGHILYGVTNLDSIAETVSNYSSYSLSAFSEKIVQYLGGMVFYGGFLGALAAILIHTRFSKSISRRKALDIFAISVPLFHTFARIGCFLGGCCYGKEWSWGFIVHGNTLSPSVNDVLRIPIQLIEASCNLVIFLILLYILKKKLCEGRLIYIYMILYPIARFILEFFRGDEIRGFFLSVSTSQWISIILFTFAVIKLITEIVRNKIKI